MNKGSWDKRKWIYWYQWMESALSILCMPPPYPCTRGPGHALTSALLFTCSTASCPIAMHQLLYTVCPFSPLIPPFFLCIRSFLLCRYVLTTGIVARTLNPAMVHAMISMILISWHRLRPPSTWLLNSSKLLAMPLFWHSTYPHIWWIRTPETIQKMVDKTRKIWQGCQLSTNRRLQLKMAAYCVQRVHQVLHLAAVCQRVDKGEENRPSRAEDEEAHSRFLRKAPPLVLFLQVDECIDTQYQLGYC